MHSPRSEKQRREAYVITGPTSGIGRCAAIELAKHGTVVLVGRDGTRLADAQKAIERRGGRAISVVCDLSEMASVRRAAAEIIALDLPLAGLLNNAGIIQMRESKNAHGLDLTFATNHLGPFLLTEALMPHLSDGANVLFVGSATEDPERKPAVAVGFRGGRYISAEASARGEWATGGSSKPGMDAYATSKQCVIATALAFAREYPRLHVDAIDPGVTPATGLGRDAGAVVRILTKTLVPVVVPLLVPFIKILNTPQRAARTITKILTDPSTKTGVYFDERGHPMQGSVQVRDPTFQNRVVAETRALLATSSA